MLKTFGAVQVSTSKDEFLTQRSGEPYLPKHDKCQKEFYPFCEGQQYDGLRLLV